MNRLPIPVDDEAEEAVVGALCITSESLPTLLPVETEDFYRVDLGRVYEAASHPDLVGVVGDRRRERLAELTGLTFAYVDSLTDRALFLSNGRPWARRVIAAARRRRAMQACAALYNAIGNAEPGDQLAALVDVIAAGLAA